MTVKRIKHKTKRKGDWVIVLYRIRYMDPVDGRWHTFLLPKKRNNHDRAGN